MNKKLKIDLLSRHLIYTQRIFRILRKGVLQNPRFVAHRNQFTQDAFFHSYRLRNHGNHNYCILSGRSRGLVTSYKLARGFFKVYATHGSLYSVRKHSW